MKWGLGESYEKVDVLPKKVRAYGDITKPASTLGVGGAYLLASLFYFYYAGVPELIPDNITNIILVVGCVSLAHGASQAMNMAEDAEMDRMTPHKQNRPIPSGIITEEEARSVSWLCTGLALSGSYIINTAFGVMMTILIFFGVFYNLSPLRAKERIISIPWQAASRGLLAFPTIFAAYGDVFAPEAWALGLFMFFYVMGFQNSADIIDRKVDRDYGIKTFVVVFGVRGTVMITVASLALMMAVLGLSIKVGALPERFLWMSLIFPFCAYMSYSMYSNPYTVSDRTGNHPAWLWFYLGMVLTVAIPLVMEIALTA